MTQTLDFAAFFREVAAPLLGYLRRLGASQALAEDVAQDAFEGLVAKGGLHWDALRARMYVYRSASNGYIDACRRRKPEVDWDSLPEQGDQAIDTVADELFTSPAWHALNARQRQLLWLAYAEEFSHREIASICGINENSVRVLLFRTRDKLKNAMEAP